MSLRRIVLGILGLLLILIGCVLLVLPGPGLLVIAMGVIVLSWEFEWARRLVRRFKKWTQGARPPRSVRGTSAREADRAPGRE